MRKVVPLFALLVVSLVLAGGAFLALHDGQTKEDVAWLPGGGRIHALERVISEWLSQQRHVEPENPMGNGPVYYGGLMFHPRRLPIGGNRHWDGDNLVLDMFPAPEGREGQILGFVTECDLVLLADSFGGLLRRYVELVEGGRLVVLPVEDYEYAFEVRPADYAKRNAYQSRWDELFDPQREPKPLGARRPPQGRAARRGPL